MKDETIHRWTSFRNQVSRTAIDSKDSQLAISNLVGLYQELPAEDRIVVDSLLADWLGSDDEGLRFDAVAVISACRILVTTPALEELKSRLQQSKAPSARYELAKVERTLSELSEHKAHE